MRLFLIVLIFLIIGALLIISNNGFDLKDEKNIEKFSNLYFSWLSKIALSFKSVTGEIIKTNWFPN